jgi:hypothetical protein
MAEPTQKYAANTPEQEAKLKEERRTKERDAVRKLVDEAAAKHDELGKKFLKEDAEEAAKK